MTVLQESKWEKPVREFLLLFNQRVCRSVNEGSVWARMRPPTFDEASDVQKDNRVLPFTRVGSLATVIDACSQYVTVRCGGDALMYGREEFLSTWTRAVQESEWKGCA